MAGWHDILKKAGAGKYANILKLKSAEVCSSSNTVRVLFECGKPLQYNDMLAVRTALVPAFSPAALDTRFCFESALPDCEYLREFIVQRCPAVRAFIRHTVLEYEGGRLVVTLPGDTAVSLWERLKCSDELFELISGSFGHRPEIVTKRGEPFKSAQMEEAPVLRTEKAGAIAGGAPPFAMPQAPAPNSAQQSAAPRPAAPKPKRSMIFGKRPSKARETEIHDIYEPADDVCVTGVVFKLERKDIKGGKKAIVLFSLTDFEDSLGCKFFIDAKYIDETLESLKAGVRVKVYGSVAEDKYSNNELTMDVKAVEELPPLAKRMDDAEQKRVELHLHTQMSTMDGLLNIKEAVATAARWGHTAMAVTDHGVVQAYPDFYSAAKKAGIKAIYGTEGYLADDCDPIPATGEFVVFDLETTGLDPLNCGIIEIGAVKLKDGAEVDRFSTYVSPGMPIPAKITELTGIDQSMIEDAPDTQAALTEFKRFAGDCTLVAHNAKFDVSFIVIHGGVYDIEFKNPYVDTLTMSRILLHDELENHKLGTIAEYFGIELEAHRAVEDAGATAEIFRRFLGMMRESHATELPAVFPQHADRPEKEKKRSYHIVLLVKDAEGLKNLYKLISFSHLDHFYKRPRMPRSMLMLLRAGLIVGSACEAGELMRGIIEKTADDERLLHIASFYDYLEIQPIGNNEFLVRDGVAQDEEQLRDYNRKVVWLAEKLNKPCAATGDVHFLNPGDAKFRAIIMASKGFKDADNQAPLYFKTTGEMLEEFSYLGEEKAREVVITTPQSIADQCQMLQPFPFETCAPIIDGAEEELVQSCHEKARLIYGDPLPEQVEKRLERELGSITKHGYSVLYIIARKLVMKSNEDGYLVGSRGSVGSSLAAFMSNITEVNALAPHYLCPKCKWADFDVDVKKYSCGCDMPDRVCPNCGTVCKKDGFNIPFETFLGFDGDKVPDIDLNFSGENQSSAHKFTEVLFGKGHVFRAGTISGVQDKTAFGYVLKYNEERGIKQRQCEMERLAAGCCDVKRTTGQHPGGIVVVPKNRTVYEFTPLNHPADDKESPVTTHFDFSSMHDTLVKLDILGHDDPTVIKMLQDLTGIDPKTVMLDDKETMSLFSSCDALGLTKEELETEVGTYGIPEFGTSFVRQMLVDTKTTTMDELIRIAGLSHGTDVWLNNAQTIVRQGLATLSEVICTRDDIMNFLILCGVEKKMAFTTMESVRKGKGLKPEMEAAMVQARVPEWYIESCKKIKYMFPRAHAAAYVMMAFRIAYFKVHYPAAFYAAYFTVRADEFDIKLAMGGVKKVRQTLKNLRMRELTDKEARQITILEVVMEMNLRGITLADIDIMRSNATKFVILDDKTLLPPVNAIAGLGDKAAQSIVEARTGGPFISREDLINRSHINKSNVDVLASVNALGDLPETNQISLFG